MGKVIRWNLARNKAIQTLAKYSAEIFPLRLFELVKKIPHLEIMSYIEMCEQLNKHGYSNGEITVDWVQEHLADGSQDAALLKMSNSEDTIILYNSDLFITGHTEQRIRYSIAHEIGHFILRHEFQTMISRNGISLSVYTAFEREADAFAATLLMPYNTFSRGISVSELRERYDVSKQAAETMVNILATRPFALPSLRLKNYAFSNSRKYTIPSNPFSFLGFKYFAFCSHCHGLTGGSSAKVFCAYCGTRLNAISYKYGFFKIHESFGGQIMKYSEIKVNNSGHVDVCPRCEADVQPDDFYCPICGTFLVNQCTGIFESNDPFNMPQDHVGFELEEYSGCGTKLPGYARYCTKCGAVSTFGFQQVLNPWRIEQEEKRQTNTPTVTDQDLPF